MLRPSDIAETINGEKYFTVKTFALVTNRSESNIRFLLAYGNSQRKLKCIKWFGKPLIPFNELMEFPFTNAGRSPSTIYHYNENGEQTEDIVLVQPAQ